MTRSAAKLAALVVVVLSASVAIDIVGQDQGMNQNEGHRSQGTNRLAKSQSPYLLQHADNPVNWYEWGDEAFAAAKAQNKPIFLSIGYATCHWCHVMAHESFEDETVAAMLNENYISIKVDREERPDIDQIYMQVCQMMTGSGGWPLTIVMTPDKMPFFAATYVPREARFGRMGMLELLPKLYEVFSTEPDRITATTNAVFDALKQSQQATAGENLAAADLSLGASNARQRFDARNGGFGTKPKFPSPHQLIFLMRQYYRTGDGTFLEMVESTLEAMRNGGIYDQVGFGFHRYSTDERWLVPHFEKMLYDQAMLMMAYTEAYEISGKPLFRQTVEEIAEYISRDMTSEEGGFYSAEDADSEGEEGKFYVWSTDEMVTVLNPADMAFVTETFNIEPNGNFDDEATQQPAGVNILHLSQAIGEDEQPRWSDIRQTLLAHREKRIRPELDDKVLTDWNGLMIAALAKAGAALDRPDFIASAEKAANLLLGKMRGDDGRLVHRYRNGKAGIAGNLDDYAFLAWGLMNLYEATFNVRYLSRAIDLTNTMIEQFWDDAAGGFYFTADDSEQLLIRNKDYYDGAIPSGNSVAMMNLLRIGRITANPAYDERAAAIGRSIAEQVSQVPTSFTYLLTAVAFGVGPTFEIVIAGDPAAEKTKEMIDVLRGAYHPQKVVVLRPDTDAEEIIELSPFIESQRSIGGKATAYVCQNHACDQPTTDVKAMMASLQSASSE